MAAALVIAQLAVCGSANLQTTKTPLNEQSFIANKILIYVFASQQFN